MSNILACHESSTLEGHEELTVNRIINALSLFLLGKISIIDGNSEESFYEFVKSSSIDRSAFSYNWPYIVQATRKHGFCYQNKKSIIYFYLRKKTKDFQGYQLVIVNHLGYSSEESVCELAEAAIKLNMSTIIKNVDRDKVLLWKSLSFEETIEPWSDYSFRDDNTFPELVYDINKYINAEFSYRTRCIINKILREKEYTFLIYDDSFRQRGWELLEKNAEYLQNKGVDYKNEIMLAHKFVFDDSIKNKIILAVLEHDKLVCLSFLTQVEENLFFNAIINENKSNVMRFLLWKSVVHYCQGLEDRKRPLYLALQGSENEGQNKWKKFFHPIRVIDRTHVTNAYGRANRKIGFLSDALKFPSF